MFREFAYVVNDGNGAGSVSAYSANRASGVLTELPGSPFAAGANPSAIAIAIPYVHAFAYVANTTSANVSAYTIDGTTGALAPVGGSHFPPDRASRARSPPTPPASSST